MNHELYQAVICHYYSGNTRVMFTTLADLYLLYIKQDPVNDKWKIRCYSGDSLTLRHLQSLTVDITIDITFALLTFETECHQT